MSDGYTILTLDEAERAQHRGSNLIPVRHTLGFQPAGVNAWIADAGGQLIPPHEEDSGNEELYVVVRGRATFTVDEETNDATAGTFVFVPAEVHRTARAEEDGTIVFAVGGTSGGAFNPAIALGAMVTGLFEWGNIWIYLIADFLGAAAAAYAFFFVLPAEKATGDIEAAATQSRPEFEEPA